MLTRGGELTVFYHGFSTQEDLDEQYNLWESVPDFLPRLRYEQQKRKPHKYRAFAGTLGRTQTRSPQATSGFFDYLALP
jgi:hypothetical protein